jgi:hypothetical protein
MGLRQHGWWRIATVVAAVFALTRPARANDLTADLEVAIHLKILSFDDGLKERVTANTIVIAVLYPAKYDVGVADYVAAITDLADKQKVMVHGKKLRAIAVPIAPDLGDKLSGVHVLYVMGTASADQVAAVSKISFANKMPTLCGNRGFLSNGLAVAVVAKENKPSIVVHAANAAHAGMVLDSKLLRLAEIVK